ncbi:RICIN domain-containing protein [Erythrobacter sp. F6033]|uniref:RICIN domain-containing protein n=1 Tax=Erythrobacter sp. F6033 TaxID=2926401 RepID=UPI001FF6EF1B|nr:RICIN domain-containing protein [Erythrobacter sp. F6033]MCK0129249.1 RICIN domain-containing protein [Erythrobacter sp. F6033]
MAPRMILLSIVAVFFLWTTVANAQYMRIENRWSRDYVHNQYGKAEAGPILSNWASAKWAVESADGGRYFRFKNAWRGTYIHNQNGKLELSEAQPGWWSAMWQSEDVGGGFFRLKNRWKGTYLYLDDDGLLAEGEIPYPNYLPAQWRLTELSDPINNVKITPLEQQCFDMIDGVIPHSRVPQEFYNFIFNYAKANIDGWSKAPGKLTYDQMQEMRGQWLQLQQGKNLSVDYDRNYKKREEAKRYCVGVPNTYNISNRVWCYVSNQIASANNPNRNYGPGRCQDERTPEEIQEEKDRAIAAQKAYFLRLDAIRHPLLSDTTRPCNHGALTLKKGSGDRTLTLKNESDRTLFVTIVGTNYNRLSKVKLPRSQFFVVSRGQTKIARLRSPGMRTTTYEFTNVLVFDDQIKSNRNNNLNWFRQAFVALKDYAKSQQSDLSQLIQKTVKDVALDGREPPTPTLEKVIEAGVVGISDVCTSSTYEMWGADAPLWVTPNY